MATSISKQRKALKEELTAGNKKTIVDVLLHWVSRGRQVSTWSGIVLTFFVTLIISIILGLISGNINPIYKAGFEVPPFWVVWSFFNLFTCTASMALSNSFFHRMISLMRDQVIDKVNSTETLSDIRSWIDAVSNRSSAAVSVVLLGGFITSIALVNMTRDFTGPLSGFRLTLFLWLFLSQAFILLIFLIFTLVLSVRIRRFDLALFEADPANSEIITQISSWFSNTVFLVAAYGALQTFGLIRFGLITYYASLLLAFWTPTLAIFITCHLSLSAIIQRNKWKTLNAVQKKISAIQSGKAAISKGSREYLVWLLDYHERVKGTRNSSINLMSGVSFLNSLLLPVIAFILGNLDIITKFFSSKP